MNKIVSIDEVNEISKQMHSLGKKIVFTNGCFDLVHAGHISSFEKAKLFGDILIVGLNSDASIKRLKGDQRPMISQDYRAKLLAAIEMIDYVVVFNDDTPESLLEIIKPDVLVKGSDWKGTSSGIIGHEIVESYGGKCVYLPYIDGLSTTNIIEKIKKIIETE